MREIKFRLRIGNRIVGYERIKPDEDGYLISTYSFDNSIGGWLFEPIKHKNKDEFISLKDKKSREIYEGDILKDDNNDLFEVKFGKLPLHKSGDCVCTYPAFYAKGYGKLGSAPFYECNETGDWMEVIDNIYKNPELLKEEK